VLIALVITRFGSAVRGDAFEGDDFITGKSELATVRLRDGSVVRLGPEGRVVLAGKGQEVELGAGHASSMLGGKIGPIVTVPDAHRMIDWVQNFLVFQETPLREAVKEIESHYGVRVSIADTLLMSRTLTMWFADRTLEDVLTAVCTVIDAKCWINDKTVTIGP